MLKIFDSMKKGIVEFKSINDKKVLMYVCGVTVYDNCHIGHARSAVVFDIIYRYFKYKGYEVIFVKNFTDVDDKIINKANQENVKPQIISLRYIEEYYKDMEQIGIERPTFEPKATEHIDDMIKLIDILIRKGYAYVVGNDVYYRVNRFRDYGKLSGKKLDELISGARIEPTEKKENPLDFVLWKKSKPNEPFWKSPWGLGRPGWHVECSVMSMKYLGETFDIHGGGEDLIFPHHENEIAQSEAATGKQFARYWVHNGFVRINQEKMSKSLGNFFTIKDIIKHFNGEVLRYFFLLTHYRKPIEFSIASLNAAQEALNRFYNFKMRLLNYPKDNDGHQASEKLQSALVNIRSGFEDALSYDFNTPKAIGLIWDIVRMFNVYLDECDANNKKADQKLIDEFLVNFDKISYVLNVFRREYTQWFRHENVNIDFVESMIRKRDEVRKLKNFREADKIRDELLNMGIILEDTKNNTIWKKKK